MKNKPKIAFDLDGVIYNFINPYDDFMKSKGFRVNEEFYELDERYNINKSAGYRFMDEFGETRPFLKLPQIKEGVNEIKYCSKYADLYVITYRDWAKYGKIDTLKRLAQDGLPIKLRNVIFSKEKGDIARKLGIDIFYEDSLDNARDIIDKSDALVALVDTPYNQGEDDRICRMKW